MSPHEQTAFYEDVAPIYDRMIRWEKRLAHEGPLFEHLWAATGARTVLDASCGSGRHLPLWVSQGREVAGADASAAMLALARDVLKENKLEDSVPLVEARWDELPARFDRTFDAVFCLGNSLPYVTEPEQLAASLEGLLSRVGPGGFLMLQFKHFARMRARGERFLPLSSAADPGTGRETVCVREYQWRATTVDFSVILLERGTPDETEPWRMRTWTTPLATYGAEDVARPLRRMGARVSLHGSLALEALDPDASADVVVLARRP